MFKRKRQKNQGNRVYVFLKDLKALSPSNNQFIDLYKVTGVAPTYTFNTSSKLSGRQTWGNVTMNWWILRNFPFRINYEHILGDEYTENNMIAVNQLWLLKEAELYKEWIDDIYPEENTVITKVKYPAKDLRIHAMDFDGVKGSLWNAHPFWHYAIRVCYYVDTTDCKKLN